MVGGGPHPRVPRSGVDGGALKLPPFTNTKPKRPPTGQGQGMLRHSTTEGSYGSSSDGEVSSSASLCQSFGRPGRVTEG
jgi:hypothetical protein